MSHFFSEFFSAFGALFYELRLYTTIALAVLFARCVMAIIFKKKQFPDNITASPLFTWAIAVFSLVAAALTLYIHLSYMMYFFYWSIFYAMIISHRSPAL